MTGLPLRCGIAPRHYGYLHGGESAPAVRVSHCVARRKRAAELALGYSAGHCRSRTSTTHVHLQASSESDVVIGVRMSIHDSMVAAVMKKRPILLARAISSGHRKITSAEVIRCDRGVGADAWR